MSVRVLLINDNADHITSWLTTCAKADVVCVAVNGERGVEKAAELAGSYDVILMDHDMPVMNGADATRQILAAQPDAPIIGYSNSYKGLDALHEAGALWVCIGTSNDRLHALLRLAADGTLCDTEQMLCVDY